MSGAWQGSDRRSRLPSNWATVIVPRIKRRDGHRCTWTEHGHRCTGPADDVDHIRNNDDHSDTNLRSLCAYHHRKKSSAEGHQAQGHGPLRRRPPERHPGLR